VDAEWPMIAVRLALYGVLSGLFGLSAFSLYGLHAGERGHALAGRPPWPIDRDAIAMLLSGSATGTAWQVRVVALVLAMLAALAAAGRAIHLGLVTTASGVALATLAWAGHGVMDEGAIGWAHLTADILHLVAAGAWVGALLGLVLLVVRPAGQVDAAHLKLTHRALDGFGAVGTIVVSTIVVTGLVNAWLLVGLRNVLDLGATLYGRLLIAKLILFVTMLGLASLNRFRLTPAFERSIAARDGAGALGALRVSLAVETTCVISVLALVAWLGTIEPPASAM
jgi:putative copper resistance protein D